MRLIAGVCTHYVVYNISKKKNTVDKSKIKDKRKVKPKDKSWVKIGWRTKNALLASTGLGRRTGKIQLSASPPIPSATLATYAGLHSQVICTCVSLKFIQITGRPN